jgi:hypothetical protein
MAPPDVTVKIILYNNTKTEFPDCQWKWPVFARDMTAYPAGRGMAIRPYSLLLPEGGKGGNQEKIAIPSGQKRGAGYPGSPVKRSA